MQIEEQSGTMCLEYLRATGTFTAKNTLEPDAPGAPGWTGTYPPVRSRAHRRRVGRQTRWRHTLSVRWQRELSPGLA